MTKLITIASAKGGTGKTSIAINTGLSLTKLGYDTVVVDANLDTPHLALHLGKPMVENTIHDVLKGKKPIAKSAYSHNSGLKIIPGKLYEEDIKKERLGEEIENLIGTSAVVLIDTAAGMGEDVKQSLLVSDSVIVVTTPDIVSVTDAMKTVRMAHDLGKTVKGVVVNCVKDKKHELSNINIQELLDVPVLATVPYNDNFTQSIKRNQPLISLEPLSRTTEEFKKLALQLLQ